MLAAAFNIQLESTVLPGLVAIGKFNGVHPSLVCATTGGKVFVHSPHEASAGQANSLRYLNFNRKITALATGRLSPDNPSDLLLVGSLSSLLAYDVERNSDAFFVDVPDGVNVVIAGQLPRVDMPLAIVGGNCSIQGFDINGNDAYWTVTGDNVRAISFCDVDEDGQHELLVGSDDFAIRIFKDEEIRSEVVEAGKVQFLQPVRTTRYAYALENGTTGVYNRTTRVWRLKSKNTVSSLITFDLDADGVPEVITGYSNGIFTVRNEQTGDVVFKENMGNGVAGMVVGDYRLDDKQELIVVSQNGSVKGFLPASEETLQQTVNPEHEEDQKLLDELQEQKQKAALELRELEKSLKAIKSGDTTGQLPPDTRVEVHIAFDEEQTGIQITTVTNSAAVITNVVLLDLDGAILSGESAVTSLSEPNRSCRICIKPTKRAPCQLKMQAHIGLRGDPTSLYVHEQNVDLPRFAGFVRTEDLALGMRPTGCVSFRIHDNLVKFTDWVDSAFLRAGGPRISPTGSTLRVNFVSVPMPFSGEAVRQPLVIIAGVEGNGTRVDVRCNSMELAGEVVNDIANFFQLVELESVADFPNEMQEFEKVVETVSLCNEQRVRLTADMADSSQRIKTLIVKAEDSRRLATMHTMRMAYTELYATNNQLLTDYHSRMNNHEALLEALKQVNQMIQRASSVRVGTAKTRVITDARAAVKTNNVRALSQIIRDGYDGADPGRRK